MNNVVLSSEEDAAQALWVGPTQEPTVTKLRYEDQDFDGQVVRWFGSLGFTLPGDWMAEFEKYTRKRTGARRNSE